MDGKLLCHGLVTPVGETCSDALERSPTARSRASAPGVRCSWRSPTVTVPFRLRLLARAVGGGRRAPCQPNTTCGFRGTAYPGVPTVTSLGRRCAPLPAMVFAPPRYTALGSP